MNRQKNKRRKTKGRTQIMKLFFIGGAVWVGACLIGGGFVNIAPPRDTKTEPPQSTNDTHYEIRIIPSSAPDIKTNLPQNPNDPYYAIHNIDKAQSTPESTPPDTSAWNLLLVNPWNELPADFSVELTQLKNGHAVDKRVYPDLQEMMDAMRAEGLSPLICSSYRTNEKQKALYDNQVNGYLAQGYSRTKAEEQAGRWVAVPGTSEHQTGLAVDIVDIGYQVLDEKQEDTAVQKWLMENSWRYGFILRYPSDKSDITGICYEPWHYRYVGRETAKEIYEKDICLEEYLE